MGGACQKNHLLKSADKLQQDTPLRLKESDKMETFLGILIPFLGTTLGAACVFFMKKSLGDLVQRSLAGFAAGVMVAASIWSLLIPAIEQSEDMGKLSFLPAFIGFWVGVLFLLLLDHLIPHLHVGSEQAEGPRSSLSRTAMMVLAVTLHNIPEGMAVGVMYILIAVCNTAALGHFAQWRTVKQDTQPVSVNFVQLETLLGKDDCCFSEVTDLFFCADAHIAPPMHKK